MQKTYKKSPKQRRCSIQYPDYVLPKLFKSVDIHKKKECQIKIASLQQINEIMFPKRNRQYQTTANSVASDAICQEIAQDTKAYEVKIGIRLIKTNKAGQSFENRDSCMEYQEIKIKPTKIDSKIDEVSLSRKLQKLVQIIT